MKVFVTGASTPRRRAARRPQEPGVLEVPVSDLG